VRWRENERRRSRCFRTRKLAEAFALSLRNEQEAAAAGIDTSRGQITLSEFLQEWWSGHGVHLARSTQQSYAGAWDRYIGPALGERTLDELSAKPELVQQFHAEMAKAGVGKPTIRRTLTILQGALQRAIEWNRIRYNPAAAHQEAARRQHPFSRADDARGHRGADLTPQHALFGRQRGR